MDKELFAELTKSMSEAAAISRKELKPSRTFHIETPDVKEIRQKVGLSQTMFAQLIGVKLKTLQNWEQQRRHPNGAVTALLTIVSREPKAALRALHG